MAERKDISPADRDLFRRSVGSVTRTRHNRVRNSPRHLKQVTGPSGKMISTAGSVPGISNPHTVGIGDVINFRRPGIQQRTLSRLKRGQIAIGRELDLHGETNMAAQEQIKIFLEMCVHDGIRCIRIIHGKGHGSRNKKPVIKNLLNNVLRENGHVLAFTSAPASDGGTGVLYVLLRKSPVNPVSDKPV